MCILQAIGESESTMLRGLLTVCAAYDMRLGSSQVLSICESIF